GDPGVLQTLEQCEWCGKRRMKLTTDPTTREFIATYYGNRYSSAGLSPKKIPPRWSLPSRVKKIGDNVRGYRSQYVLVDDPAWVASSSKSEKNVEKKDDSGGIGDGC
ncbi:MAG: hypothetical protein Q4A66_12295, partial [Eubacteriales bacterium]|nr:hypothetical protein [Eubacteriales bacterium]